MWRNRGDSYGLMAIILHWGMAVVILGLFILGLWMVELTYYDDWYRAAPTVHKGIGVLLFLTLMFRLIWRLANPPPSPFPGHSQLERRASKVVHGLLYLLLFTLMISGYLISTADGRPIDVFGLFQVPASVTGLPDQADRAGEIHLVLAVTLISVAAVHALGALKHHFIDGDATLVRMLRIRGA